MKDLFQKLGLTFKKSDEGLFEEAFTHRSAVNENSVLKKHNERLEFLGDAVLELIVTEFLYKKFPRKPEGDLTNLRAALVKGDHLAEVARRLDFGTYLKLSHGEAKSGGANKDYLLANVVEAFLGAVYMTHGIEEARRFVQKFILCDLERILETKEYIDAKSEFQELSQGELGITPSYKVISEHGKDHEKIFEVEAFLGEQKVGVGAGPSKKDAQLAAAVDAIKKKRKWLKP